MAEVSDRAGAAADGVLRVTGMTKLRRTLGSAEMAKPFAEWAGGSFTRLVRRAIRDLALNGFDAAPKDTSVAYGMTLGLQLAAQLMEDPSAVYPDVFARGGSQGVDLSVLEQTFDTAPDEM